MRKNLLLIIPLSFIIISTGSTTLSPAVYADCTTSQTAASCSYNLHEGSFCSSYQLPLKSSEVATPEDALQFKHFIKSLEYERWTMYNALNLSDDQIQAREDMLKENSPVYDEKFECLMKESFKLKALKCASASEKEISQQKRVVQNIKKDIEKMFESEEKTFKKCLTRQQRSKYSMISKLYRQDGKRNLHEKDYYKSNPQMKPFGDPGKNTCPDDECEKN